MNKTILRLKLLASQIDWKILLFLILLLNVKIFIKLAAVALIYLLNRNFSFGFRLKQSRLPLFYIVMPAIALFNWVINSGFTSMNSTVAFVIGLLLWLICILSIHQLKLFTERASEITIHNTLLLFFVINILVSLLNYFQIVIETGAINPFHFRGLNEKYFISTGDYIKGITFDTSLTNSVLSAIGVVYFLSQKKTFMTGLSMAVLLLTGSNATNILMVVVLLYQLFFQSTAKQKGIIGICFSLMLIFLVGISSENAKYVRGIFRKLPPFGAVQSEQKKATPTPAAATATLGESGKPGKLLAYRQTARYLTEHPLKMISGAGMGNFSSKLAFRTTAMNIDGNYPEKLSYIHPDFRENHLKLYLAYFKDKVDYHSVMNRPHSIYDQVASEYGLVGVLSFIVFYAGYFFSVIKRKGSFAVPLILLTGGAFLLDYWFEQLSIIVIVELLLLAELTQPHPISINDKA